jgi:hypothetical protein
MKTLSFFFLCILLLQSCITKKACNRKFPQNTNTVTNTVTLYRDTIIYINLPGQTVTSPGDTVYIDRFTNLATSEKSFLHTSLAISTAQVIGGILKHNLIQKDTTLQRLIADAVKLQSTHSVTEKQIVREVNVLFWWQKILMWIGFSALLYFLLRIYISYRIRI